MKRKKNMTTRKISFINPNSGLVTMSTKLPKLLADKMFDDLNQVQTKIIRIIKAGLIR